MTDPCDTAPAGGAAPLAIASYDDDALQALLDAYRHVGDPLADDVVETFAQLPGGAGWRAFEHALATGPASLPDAPAPLRALLAQASTAPAWLDLEAVDRGALSIWRTGAPTVSMALAYGSLAFGYQSPDLTRPLALTGRLERMASRRLGESMRWHLDVTTPGATAPWHVGWCTSLRVRMVHALVRRRLRRSDLWDGDAWATPISAAGMLATAIGGFHVVPHRAMCDLGARTTPADRDDRTALWRWVGYVMGVPEHVLPVDWAQSERIMATLLRIEQGPNEYGARLMRALTHHGLPIEGILPTRAVEPVRALSAPLLEAMVRRWLGDEVSDGLGVGRSPLRRFIPLVRPIVRLHAAAIGSGWLGDERRTARAQIAFTHRLLDLAGDPKTPVTPQATEREHPPGSVATAA